MATTSNYKKTINKQPGIQKKKNDEWVRKLEEEKDKSPWNWLIPGMDPDYLS